MEFYDRILRDLLAIRDLSLDDSVLVACGGPYDAQVLREAGFRRVTITNMDERMNEELRPYEWSKQDTEQLSFEDATYDWSVVHGGLHHCVSPHRGLLELCRVARKGVIVIEARDSFLVRLAVLFGMTVDYETEAVVLENYQSGGVRNSKVPNYVYRWTEREVRKTIESAYPHRVTPIRFYYQMRLPLKRLRMSGPMKRLLAIILGFGAKAFQLMFRRQCNGFGFVIMTNTGILKPWIQSDGDGFCMRRDYRLNYDPNKYKK